MRNVKIRLPKPPAPPKPVEHPDDKKIRLASIARAERDAPAFCAKFDAAAILKALVTTYADCEAEELFVALRESFWAEQPVKNYKVLKQFAL